MNFEIREATIKDTSIITDIIRTSFLNVANQFNLTLENTPKHPSNCKEEWISSAIEKGIYYFLLEIANPLKIIGCCALEKVNSDIGYIERLAVLPSFREKGYGTALVKYAVEQAKRFKIKRIEIGIIADDIKLRRWYENLGFVIKNQALFDHLPFKVLFMFLNLY